MPETEAVSFKYLTFQFDVPAYLVAIFSGYKISNHSISHDVATCDSSNTVFIK